MKNQTEMNEADWAENYSRFDGRNRHENNNIIINNKNVGSCVEPLGDQTAFIEEMFGDDAGDNEEDNYDDSSENENVSICTNESVHSADFDDVGYHISPVDDEDTFFGVGKSSGYESGDDKPVEVTKGLAQVLVSTSMCFVLFAHV
jgi:hypothetical protein